MSESSMQVVILAGGMGTRLRAVAGELPKALVPVAGRPFVEHQLELLVRGGLCEVLMCVGYKGHLIERHLGDGSRFDCRIQYSFEDPAQLLGTGGALLNALPLLAPAFLVMYGDSYLPTDYGAIVRAFEAAQTPAMMSVHRNEGKWDPSNVRISGDRVVYYSKAAEPGTADYIDYGLSAFRKSVIQTYREVTLPLDLARIQEDLVRRELMGAFVVAERFYEIGKPEGLAGLEEHLRSKKNG